MAQNGAVGATGLGYSSAHVIGTQTRIRMHCIFNSRPTLYYLNTHACGSQVRSFLESSFYESREYVVLVAHDLPSNLDASLSATYK